MAKKLPRVFYAYPSRPPHVGETITSFSQKAVETNLAEIKPWEEMHIVGLRIINQITEEIGKCDIFACDLTYLNMNVLFELGFAIAKKKKIWATMNMTIQDAHTRYKSMGTLVFIGYKPYNNHHELLNRFGGSGILSGKYESLAEQLNLFSEKPSESEYKLLYLKSGAKSDASYDITEVLSSSKFKIIADDPSEIPPDTLEWYCNNISSSHGAVISFMSKDEVNNEAHNNKAALIAGISYGYGIPVMLVAPSPFEVPSDNHGMVKVYELASQAKTETIRWTTSLLDKIQKKKQVGVSYVTNLKKAKSLSIIHMGEIVAENEDDDLYKYFVETGAFYEIIGGQQTIYVGRKGTGKSANLIAARDHFTQDKRNVVCIIKPAGYEVDGLLNTLNNAASNEERGYIIESLWKYLVYSEIANTIVKKYDENSQLTPNQDEKALIDYCDLHKSQIKESFSYRLREAIKRLSSSIFTGSENENRPVISETLHIGIIGSLKKKLSPILAKKNKVVILVDNLDQAWTTGIDVPKLSEVLFGLLNASQKIASDLKNSSRTEQYAEVIMTVFIRSDIYTHILNAAKERDKLEITRIVWRDPEILGRVIDKRLQSHFEIDGNPEDIWKQFFVEKIDDLSPKDYIIANILPRPRDAIFFIKSAISTASSRGHSVVQENDFFDAAERYSKWAYDSILVEDDPSKKRLEEILLEFVGNQRLYNESQVYKILNASCNVNDIEFYFNLLCDLSFLEIEDRSGVFKVPADEEERSVWRMAISRKAQSENREPRYRVNRPFRSWLQID